MHTKKGDMKPLKQAHKEHLITRLYRSGFGPFEIWERTGVSPQQQNAILESEIALQYSDDQRWNEATRISKNFQLREFEVGHRGSSPEEDAIRRLVNFLPDHEFFSQVRLSNETETVADCISIDRKTGQIHCYEIKATRSDLIHEIKNPKKSKVARGVCHFWWLALSGPRFKIKDISIPGDAGLIDLHLDTEPQIVAHAKLNKIAVLTVDILTALSRSIFSKRLIEDLCLENAELRDRIIRMESSSDG